MRRWRQEEGDNPAWPGLVDIFAFTMVLFMLLLGAVSPNTDLEKKIKQLKEEIKKKEEEINQLKNKLSELKEGFFLRGKKDLEILYEHLKEKVDNENFTVSLDLKNLEIKIKGSPEVSFETARYTLSAGDRERLQRLAPVLAAALQGKPFYVLINGTADPRELKDRGVPPHDNVQLSALRAAAVAALLEKAAPGLGEDLRIVGLGVKGREVPLAPGIDPDEAYRRYRIVDVVVKVDLEKMLEASTGKN
jgi:flagellar motor protein MotB